MERKDTRTCVSHSNVTHGSRKSGQAVCLTQESKDAQTCVSDNN